jgi:hypothetical protein
MTPREAPERQKVAYFVRDRNAVELTRFYDDKIYKPFGGSRDIRYDEHGNLHYLTAHNHRHIEELEQVFILVAKDEPQYDLFAPDVRQKETRVNCTHTLENAIRMTDHVLEETNTEKSRLEMIETLAGKLIQNLRENYPSITPEDFERLRAETITKIRESGRDPFRAIDKEKKRMYRLLIKGSAGKDSLDRQNPDISVIALYAVIADAQRGLRRVDSTLAKFTAIQETCVSERKSSIAFLMDITLYLTSPTFSPTDIYLGPVLQGKIVSRLDGMLSQLDSLVVNPYLGLAIELKPLIVQLRKRIRKGEKPENIGTICTMIQNAINESTKAYMAPLHKVKGNDIISPES